MKRVLIVDDSPIVLMAARYVLVEAGYDVETRDGVEELGAQGATGFDLILMDVQMPQLYGDDVASILRNDRQMNTPIYLFSTLPNEELAVRARDARVDGYISKDLGMSNLVDEVRRILG
ncbi:MAG: response regulator [Myxococcota bacterium]|nr:response regulator [Myxococcota bacterium]